MGSKTIAASVAIYLTIAAAEAQLTVAGIHFDDNAFSDTVNSAAGSFMLFNTESVEEAFTGSNLDAYGFSVTPGAFIELGFVDNAALNCTGDDIAFFELGPVQEPIMVSLNTGGMVSSVQTVDTGLTNIDGLNINYGTLDLSDLGVPVGDDISSLVISVLCENPDFCQIGDQIVSPVSVAALYSSPPASACSDAEVLLNFSFNGFVSENGIAPGFIVSETAQIAVTAESLAGIGGPGLTDPQIRLRALFGGTIDSNDNCDRTDMRGLVGRELITSNDACLVTTLRPGGYVAIVTDSTGGSGNALVSVTKTRQ